MTWTTPKTNWYGHTSVLGTYTGDYFNSEDAQRITNNLNHLKSMSDSIYGAYNEVCVLSGATNLYVYTIYPSRNLVVSTWDKADYILASSMVLWLHCLADLYYLSGSKTYSYLNEQTAHSTTYEGYGVVDQNVNFTNFPKTYSGINRSFYYDSTYAPAHPERIYYGQSTPGHTLHNTLFFSYTELNIIESRIQTIYERFTSYLEA